MYEDNPATDFWINIDTSDSGHIVLQLTLRAAILVEPTRKGAVQNPTLPTWQAVEGVQLHMGGVSQCLEKFAVQLGLQYCQWS
jgi:hypothetical protein